MNVLKGKITDSDKHVADTREVLIQHLIKVVTNLPHKLKIYAGVLYLVATENAEFAGSLLTELLPALVESSFSKIEGFRCRNASAFIGYLHRYGLLSDDVLTKFIDALRSADIPRTLLIECIVASRATIDQAEIDSFKSQVLEPFTGMLRLDDVNYRATQPNSDVLLGLSDVSKLETPVVLDLNFDIKVLNSELSFQNHLEGKYPSRAHHPMPLDMEGLPDAESR